MLIRNITRNFEYDLILYLRWAKVKNKVVPVLDEVLCYEGKWEWRYSSTVLYLGTR
jgi:hypothetical protein